MSGNSRQQTVSIFPILTVNFIGTLGFSLVLPFLIFLVTRWGGNPFIYGVIGATYSSFQLVGAPILGRWSDRYGRRRILLLSQAGTLFSWAVFMAAFALPADPIFRTDWAALGEFAVTLPLLLIFIARAFDGLTGGNVSVANAYLADITKKENRSANFGKMAVSANLGFVLGPAIAGLLGATVWGELLPVFAALIISLLATLIIAFRLPESKPCTLEEDPEEVNVRKIFGQEQRPCFEIEGEAELSVREIFRLHKVASLLVVYFLVMLGFNFFYVAFPLYVTQGLQWSVSDIGIYFSVLSLLMALVQGPILSHATRWLADAVLAGAGSLILSASFLFFVSSQTSLLYLGAVLLAIGNGLMWPSVISMLSEAAGERHQGTVQGFAGSIGAGASILGFLLGGALYVSLDVWVFFLSSSIILGVFLIFLWLSQE